MSDPSAAASLKPPANPSLGIVLVLISTGLFAVLDTLSKYVVRDYPATAVVWMRYGLPLLLITLYAAPRMGRGLLRTVSLKVQVLRGLLMTGATLCMVFALRVMPLAEAQAIGFLAPVLLTLLATRFLSEKVSLRGWLGVLAGFVGVLIIIRPGGGLFSLNSLLPLGQAFTLAVYQMVTRQVGGRDHPITSLFYIMLVGTLVMTPPLIWVWEMPNGQQALMLLAIGVLAMAGHFLMIKGLVYTPASRLAPFFYAQLVWVTILGALVFDAIPDPVSLLGIAVVAAGGLTVAFSRGK